MNLNKYPDGTSYVSDTKLGQQVFRLNSYEDLWHLNQFVDAFHSQYDALTYKIKPNIVIPNLIDAQADRRFEKGTSSGLKLVCKFLNSLDANFTVFHPHNQEVVEALMDNVEIMDNHSFIAQVLNFIEDTSNLVLISSDAGGFKPLIKLCSKLNWAGEVFSASKSRDSQTGQLTQLLDREDFQGKDILIVDDICIYGGTFKGLSKMLRSRSCGKLYLAVSHMTVQNLGEDPVTGYFDKVFTTNSKYSNYIYKTLVKHHGLLDALAHPNNLEIAELF